MTESPTKQTKCIDVPKELGNIVKIHADRLGLVNKQLQITKDENRIQIPLLRDPKEQEWLHLKILSSDLQLGTCSFQERKKSSTSLDAVLKDQLPANSMNLIPRSLDVIGDIAIVEVEPELEKYKAVIGESILKVHPNIKTVLAKTGAVTGTYRLRQVENIAGEQRTDTTHKEYGCQFNVDIAKAYFSPRLSTEHKRVSSLIQENETALDLFAGVGPFSILIAKNHPDAKVYAIDLNPYAVELLKQNIRLNRVENRVFPIVGDAKQIVKQQLGGTANRVIMNLPERAAEFIDVACEAIKREGGLIHFYGFLKCPPDSLESAKQKFADAVLKSGRQLAEFSSSKTIRETAPFEWQFVLDAKIF